MEPSPQSPAPRRAVPPPSWHPILDPDLTERARSGIRAIRRDLHRLSAEGEFSDDPALSTGSAGIALFAAYTAELADPAHGSSEEFLDTMTESLRRTRIWMDLFQGATGPGWVVEHLSGRHATGGSDPTEEIVNALGALLDRDRWLDSYDLVIGLVGFGLFALERLPEPRARRILERIVGHLESSAERTPAGTTWHTPPEWLPSHQREVCPRGHYNLGLAHGVPGVVAFLSATSAAGVARGRCARLAGGAVDWILAQELPEGSPARFPSWVGPRADPAPARLAWCYGDLGVATSLHLASTVFDEPRWRRHALRIARQAAGRSFDTSQATTAGFCHGSAGVAHLFNRLYQATGDEELGRAGATWFRHTLDRREPGRGVGGYRHRFQEPDTGRSVWKAPRGLLLGAAGVGMALAAAASTVEPEWDRLFLLSCRRLAA